MAVVVLIVAAVLVGASVLWARNERRSALRSLDELKRSTEAAEEQADAAHGDLARATWALEAIPQGVVIVDETGHEVFRNETAHAFASARHAEVLVEQAIQEALAAAIDGVPQRRNIDVL